MWMHNRKRKGQNSTLRIKMKKFWISISERKKEVLDYDLRKKEKFLEKVEFQMPSESEILNLDFIGESVCIWIADITDDFDNDDDDADFNFTVLLSPCKLIIGLCQMPVMRTGKIFKRISKENFGINFAKIIFSSFALQKIANFKLHRKNYKPLFVEKNTENFKSSF